MSEDAGKERKAYRGERLAIVMRYVRSGQEISKWDAELLASEIDRLRGELLKASRDVEEICRLKCELQKREQDLLNATRYQAPHDCEQWLTDARCCTRCSAEFSRILERRERETTVLSPLAKENVRLNRELDMTRAARDVALDKLLQIARVVSPDDFEEADA